MNGQIDKLCWSIGYNGEKPEQEENYETQKKIWLEGGDLGEQFLKHADYKINYKKEDVIAEARNLDNERRLLIIILDESTSMKGERWTKAKEGVEELINSLVKRYEDNKGDPSKMDLMLYFFATYPRL